MNQLLDRRQVDASDVVGNFIGGDVSGTLVQTFIGGNATVQEPALVWQELPGDPSEIFQILTWHVRLTDIYGRAREMRLLRDWVSRDGGPRVRIVSGPGGSGKTRLAAEFADQLRQEGWTAGFWRLDRAAVFPVRSAGLLLVLDYPEQHRDGVRALLRDLAALERTPAPIRILLLSRQTFAWWADDIDAAGAGHLLDTQDVGVESLSEAEALEMYGKAAAALARRYGRPWAGPQQAAFDAWLQRDPSTHLLPLFVRAAALHSVLEPTQTLDFSSGRIVAELVRRERQRLRSVSEATGLGAEGLPRLAGLAAAGGGLDAAALQRLAEPGLQLGLPPPEQVVDAVRRVPWWHDQALVAPTPDVLAAELLAQILAQRPDLNGEWLWAAITGGQEELTDRLGRLLYDLGRLSEAQQAVLREALVRMVTSHPDRVAPLRFLARDSRLPVSLAPVAVAVCRVGLAMAEADADRSYWLHILSNRLAETGDVAGALEPIHEAVAIRGRLATQHPARFERDLAGSLNNLSNRLANTGDVAGALEPIREAVAIWRRLAAQNPARFEPEVAISLNNLSSRLAATGDVAGALEPVREAVAIRDRLATRNPARFEPDLAGSLNDLSNRLGDTGDALGALEPIRAAVVIWRRLATQNPARFEPDLATSLNNLSNRLAGAGDVAGALKPIREAAEIRRRLATQSPARFEADLAQSLHNLSNCLAGTGDVEGALGPIREAVEIWRRLATQSPARFEPDLAGSLNNLSNCLADAGDAAGALEPIREAVAIRRRLATQNLARFEPDLATSLNNLSNRLAGTGDVTGALQPIREATEIRRRLATHSPARFEPELATSLNNVSNRLAGTGDVAGALEPIREAAEIRRRLATENPARFEPDLATSLNNLSNRLAGTGNVAGALEPIREAVEIRRRLATQSPLRFEPDLAGSLNDLSNHLARSGDVAGALEPIHEAVAIWRRLTEQNPARFGANLALSLNNLSRRLDDAGRLSEASEAAKEAVRLAAQSDLLRGRRDGRWRQYQDWADHLRQRLAARRPLARLRRIAGEWLKLGRRVFGRFGKA